MLRIIRRPEIQAMTGLGRTRIDELERAGNFPARIRISTRACGWRSDEVERWIDSRPRAADIPADRGNTELRAKSGVA